MARNLFKNLPDIESKENEFYKKAVKEHTEKWNEQEQKKIAHYEELKEDRIKNYLLEKENLKKLRQEQKRIDEIEKIQKVNNEKIDFIFDRQQRMEKLTKLIDLRKFINEQIEMDKKSRQNELIQNRYDTNCAIESTINKDDQIFFNYATKLLRNAEKNGFPIKPLKKAIHEYKIDNYIISQKDDLPHLKSHIDIGISLERKYPTKLNRCKNGI